MAIIEKLEIVMIDGDILRVKAETSYERHGIMLERSNEFFNNEKIKSDFKRFIPYSFIKKIDYIGE